MDSVRQEVFEAAVGVEVVVVVGLLRAGVDSLGATTRGRRCRASGGLAGSRSIEDTASSAISSGSLPLSKLSSSRAVSSSSTGMLILDSFLLGIGRLSSSVLSNVSSTVSRSGFFFGPFDFGFLLAFLITALAIFRSLSRYA